QSTISPPGRTSFAGRYKINTIQYLFNINTTIKARNRIVRQGEVTKRALVQSSSATTDRIPTFNFSRDAALSALVMYADSGFGARTCAQVFRKVFIVGLSTTFRSSRQRFRLYGREIGPVIKE